MANKRLDDLDAWQRSLNLAERIYIITRLQAFDRDWGLRDQIRRAAVSIPSNIAEGYERNSDRDFNRFILIAKGSAAELRTQIILAGRIGYIPLTDVSALENECIEISSMLSGISKYLIQKINSAEKR